MKCFRRNLIKKRCSNICIQKNGSSHIDIIAYKRLSIIHKVDSQIRVDELNAMTISDDFEIDKSV